MTTTHQTRHAKLLVTLAALLLTCVSASPGHAQTAGGTIRVATRILPPVVAQESDRLTGFGIELWNDIATRLSLTTSYKVEPDIDALLASVASEQADVGVGAVSITSKRFADFDFSEPILNAGLQVLVPGHGSSGDPGPLQTILRLLLSEAILVWLGIALLLILVPAHLVWFFERKHSDGIIPTKRYIPGIFYAMYWAAGTLATQAEQMPRHWVARILATLWMFVGVVFVAYYTAQLTATLTVQKFQTGITGPKDLPGKVVATIRGSTSADYLHQQKIQDVEFDSMDEAYRALLDHRADAIVFDSPVLLYLAGHEGKGIVRVVGSVFRTEDYGFVFKSNNPIRKSVDSALLAAREDGTYQRLYEEWFGER